MFYGKFDSYYYSRPVSYRSYTPKITRQEILTFNDQQTNEVLAFLKAQGIQVQDLGGLSRGLRFWDFELGRRVYNHNNYKVSDEFFIHQWKNTNDLSKQHPTGVHLVFHSFQQFFDKLIQIVNERNKKI